MRHERRAKESRRALFINHQFARMRGEFVENTILIFRLVAHGAEGGFHTRRISMTRGINHRDASRTRCGKELLGGLNRLPGIFTARARMFAVHFKNWLVPAFIGFVIKINRQNGRLGADIKLAMIGFVDFENLGADNIFPAMVFEIARHLGLPFLSRFLMPIVNCNGAFVNSLFKNGCKNRPRVQQRDHRP